MRIETPSDPPIIRIFRWVACVCLVWAAVLLVQRLWFLAHAVHTRGTVLRYQAVSHISGDQPTFHVVFSYALPDGRIVQATNAAQRNSVLSYGVEGTTLPVLYDRSHPEHAIPDAWTDLWFAPVILGGTGAFFWIFAASLAYVLRNTPDSARATSD